ncbi:MAG: hypothetical protein JNG90_07350 [Planctomycetaceae bacterium]|nr:hypothetical protein [Planctomycetaceae bacterium]
MNESRSTTSHFWSELVRAARRFLGLDRRWQPAVIPRRQPRGRRLPLLLVAALSAATGQVRAVEPAASAPERTMQLGDFRLVAPAGFVRKQPRSQIVAYEFQAPPAEGDELPGRFTVMAAGGSVEANLERWYGQFTQPDGGSTKDAAKVEELTVAGQKVVLADLSGTYDDKPAPMAPGVKRENYRMLGAIVATPDGNFYLKFYGPRKTVSAQREAFVEMVKSLKK